MAGWFDLISGGIAAAGGLMASQRAGEASDASLEAIRAQIAAANRLAGIGDEAGGALAEAFKAYIANVGGGFSAEGFDDLAGGIAHERAGGRDRIANAVDGFLADMQRGGATRDGILSTASGMRPGVGTSGPSVPMLTEGNYSDEIHRLATDFRGALDASSKGTVNRIMGVQEADAMSRGLDRSTYGIQTRKAAADQIATLSNENMLKAVQMATQQVGQNQALDLALNNASLTFNSEAFKRNLLSSTTAFDQNLRAISSASDLERTSRGLDLETIRAAIASLGGVDALVGPGESSKARQYAGADFATQAQLRGLTRAEINDLIATPAMLRGNLLNASSGAIRNASSAALTDASQWQKITADLFQGAGGAFQRWMANSTPTTSNPGVSP